jgi:hypothetical protein
VLLKKAPVVFGPGVGIPREQPGENGNFRTGGWLRAGPEALQVSANDVGHGQAVLPGVPLEQPDFLGGRAAGQSNSVPKQHPAAKKNQYSQYSQWSICPPAPNRAKLPAHECRAIELCNQAGKLPGPACLYAEAPQTKNTR